MVIFLQLLFLYFYCDSNEFMQLIIIFADVYLFILYLCNFSYIKTYENGKYSYPKITYTEKTDRLFIMHNYCNRSLIKSLKNIYVPVIELHYFFSRKKIKLRSNKMHLITQGEFPNMENCFIKKLIADKNNFDTIPDIFLPKNIKYLSAQFCNLSKIIIINNLIREIDIGNNNISELKLDCVRLEYLHLNSNKLMELEIETPNLKFLDIRNNLLENIKLKNMKLEVLNIRKNQFVVLPIEMLDINRLYLDENPIIPNLNMHKWNEYFIENYPHFFENNIDVNYENVYEDRELVHNNYVNHNIKKCITELKNIYAANNIKSYSVPNLLKKLEKSNVDSDFTLKQMMDTIYYLSDTNNLNDTLIPIIDYEIEDGRDACFSGKIGRIITGIMGFGLIKTVITISKSEEIMTKYEVVSRRLKREIDENDDKFMEMLKMEFQNELERLGLEKKEIDEWINEIKN